MIGSETVDEACDRLTPFMVEVTLGLLRNKEIASIFDCEDLGEIVGEAFSLAMRNMAS